MSPQEADEALQGYVRLVAESNGYWPEDDNDEYEKWQGVDVDDFHPDALEDIRADLRRFWQLLLKEAGSDVAAKMQLADYDFDELGADLWQVRQRSGHDFRTGDATLDEALEEAAEELGEANVEIGDDGMVRHT